MPRDGGVPYQRQHKKQMERGRIFDAEIYLVILEHYVAVTQYPYPPHIYVKSIHLVLDLRTTEYIRVLGHHVVVPQNH